MEEIRSSVKTALHSMAYKNVTWTSPDSFEFDDDDAQEKSIVLVGRLGDGASRYLEHMARTLCGSGVKPPSKAVNRQRMMRVRKASRAARPAVRQTFAARRATKLAESGGSSDPDGRRPPTNSRHLLAISSSFLGGAK